MTYLSPEIEALAKLKRGNSLIKKENSCGIFQDYGKGNSNPQNKDNCQNQ